MNPIKYKKKPVIIEALQFKSDMSIKDLNDLIDFIGMKNIVDTGRDNLCLTIRTLEGNIIASLGDYIIKGIQGEFYSCKPDIFEQTYDKIEEIND